MAPDFRWDRVAAAEFASAWTSPARSFRTCSAPPEVGTVRYSNPPAALASWAMAMSGSPKPPELAVTSWFGCAFPCATSSCTVFQGLSPFTNKA